VRLLPAAVASLALSAGAAAGTIDGTVTFPSERVPSMTVYASDLETSRVHSVQLARGQANFSVEVPAGRYVVFLAPNEPGAPNVYGAYTEYSLCTPHDVDGKCEDHSLVPIVISARTPHGAVTVDDWYLSDDIARQIDRIRGAAAAFYSEPLSAPRFSEYPSASFDVSAVPKIDIGGGDLSEENRALVQQSLAGGPGAILTASARRHPGHSAMPDRGGPADSTRQSIAERYPNAGRYGGDAVLRLEYEKCSAGTLRRISTKRADLLFDSGTLTPIMR
jgi:hypothetical protein